MGRVWSMARFISPSCCSLAMLSGVLLSEALDVFVWILHSLLPSRGSYLTESVCRNSAEIQANVVFHQIWLLVFYDKLPTVLYSTVCWIYCLTPRCVELRAPSWTLQYIVLSLHPYFKLTPNIPPSCTLYLTLSPSMVVCSLKQTHRRQHMTNQMEISVVTRLPPAHKHTHTHFFLAILGQSFSIIFLFIYLFVSFSLQQRPIIKKASTGHDICPKWWNKHKKIAFLKKKKYMIQLIKVFHNSWWIEPRYWNHIGNGKTLEQCPM